MVNLDRCDGSCNIVEDPTGRTCAPYKTGDVNLRVLNMIIGRHELKILIKHISWKCGCKFDGRRCNSKQQWFQ